MYFFIILNALTMEGIGSIFDSTFELPLFPGLCILKISQFLCYQYCHLLISISRLENNFSSSSLTTISGIGLNFTVSIDILHSMVFSFSVTYSFCCYCIVFVQFLLFIQQYCLSTNFHKDLNIFTLVFQFFLILLIHRACLSCGNLFGVSSFFRSHMHCCIYCIIQCDFIGIFSVTISSVTDSFMIFISLF